MITFVVLTVIVTAGLVAGGFFVGFSAGSVQNPSPILADSVQTATSKDVSADTDLVQVYDRLDDAVVKIRAVETGKIDPEGPPAGRGSVGSGFVISRRGYVVTNNHVVNGAADVAVGLSDGTYARAEVIGRDPGTDLALLKIDPPPDGLTVAELADSDKVQVGQLVLAIGSPFDLERSLTIGYVSGLARSIPTDDDYVTHIHGAIQTDAAINPGNSGGPLLDAQGRVIGVNTAIFSTSGGSQGVGFAIPSNTVQEVVPTLMRAGFVPRPYLGVDGVPLNDRLASRLGVDLKRGLLIQEVHEDSGAGEAGIRAGDDVLLVRDGFLRAGGDVLLSVAGVDVDEMKDVSKVVSGREIGESVEVTVWRDGEELTLTVVLQAAPHGGE